MQPADHGRNAAQAARAIAASPRPCTSFAASRRARRTELRRFRKLKDQSIQQRVDLFSNGKKLNSHRIVAEVEFVELGGGAREIF